MNLDDESSTFTSPTSTLLSHHSNEFKSNWYQRNHTIATGFTHEQQQQEEYQQQQQTNESQSLQVKKHRGSCNRVESVAGISSTEIQVDFEEEQVMTDSIKKGNKNGEKNEGLVLISPLSTASPLPTTIPIPSSTTSNSTTVMNTVEMQSKVETVTEEFQLNPSSSLPIDGVKKDFVNSNHALSSSSSSSSSSVVTVSTVVPQPHSRLPSLQPPSLSPRNRVRTKSGSTTSSHLHPTVRHSTASITSKPIIGPIHSHGLPSNSNRSTSPLSFPHHRYHENDDDELNHLIQDLHPERNDVDLIL